MIENVRYKFSENQELCLMVNSLLETYIYKASSEFDQQQEFSSSMG